MGSWHTYVFGVAFVIVLATVLGLLTVPAYANEFSLTYTNLCASFIISYFSSGFLPNIIGPGYISGDALNFSGPATLIVQADVSSSGPVELVFGPVTASQTVNIIWNTNQSTAINGTYTISVPGAGQYYLGIYNPSIIDTFVNGYMNVTACGDARFVSDWLSEVASSYSSPLIFPMNPTGIVANGVAEINGQLYTYVLTTDAVKGVVYIPSNVNAIDYSQDGTSYNNTFSIQLNAFVAVELANGQTQYYWIQNTIGLMNGVLSIGDNVWNDTAYTSSLDTLNIQGNGSIYFGENLNLFYAYEMPNPVPFGQITLEMSVHTSGGSVIINFYADGQDYDTVTIMPSAPATSAYIVIAPIKTLRGTPLDLELVFAGYSGDEPYAILQNGSINMSLYVDMDGHWVPPPSAWTVGGATYERAYASVVPNGVGSAVVEPGPLNNEELWGGTIVVTPFGTYLTTGTDLTQYAYPAVVDLDNGTRLVQLGIYINGEQASENALASVPIGSLVLEDYERQYLVTQTSVFGTETAWLNEGAQFTPNASLYVINGVTFKPVGMIVNGVSEPITALTVSKPMNVEIIYRAIANVNTTTWGMPALYASATMTCGSKVATATGILTSELTVSMLNPPTYKCTVSVNTAPLMLVIAVAIAIVATATLRRRRRRTRYYQIPIS